MFRGRCKIRITIRDLIVTVNVHFGKSESHSQSYKITVPNISSNSVRDISNVQGVVRSKVKIDPNCQGTHVGGIVNPYVTETFVKEGKKVRVVN